MKLYGRQVSPKLLLLVILILAAILRLYNLSNIPVGFNDDEAAFGYNAYSILKTSRDEWGVRFPFPAFESFGDWKLVGYLYLVVPSIFVFGLTEYATRFPSAIVGILAVFSTYLFTKQLFNSRVAILAALFICISPWHIAASRNAFESDILIFLNTLFLFYFLKSLSNINYFKYYIFIATLTFYVYRSAWFFTPLLSFCLIYIFRQKLKPNFKLIATCFTLMAIALIPIVITVLSFKGQSRFLQESFIYGPQRSGLIQDINERRGFCFEKYPSIVCQITYSKPLFYFSQFLENYIENLSANLYYIDGNNGYQSFAPRGFFYLFELPLFIAGVVYLIKKWPSQTKILLAWLFIVPLAPSLTSVGNPGRLNILLPLPQIVSALGVVFLYTSIRQKKLRGTFSILLTVVVVASFFRFIVDVNTLYPKFTARAQRYGYKEVFRYAYAEKDNYEQIAISRRADDAKQYIHFLMSSKYDPAAYQKERAYTKDSSGWQSVNQIGKFHFYESAPPLLELPTNSILITGENEVAYPKEALKYHVDDPRGDRIFEIYEIEKVHEFTKDE